MKINYVTTNAYKFEIAKKVFEDEKLRSIELLQSDLETPEIQADTAEEVASASAVWAANKLNCAVVVGDASLIIPALNNFPGPYMKYVNSTLAPDDLLLLMSNKENRSAAFIDCLAYYDPASMDYPRTFISKTTGKISESSSIRSGSMIDRLFIPDGWKQPLADIEKNEHAKIWDIERWHMLVEYIGDK